MPTKRREFDIIVYGGHGYPKPDSPLLQQSGHNRLSRAPPQSIDFYNRIGYYYFTMKTISDYEPEFTPVLLARNRHDGWTPERQRQFLIALSAVGTVDTAAHAVGMPRISAYNLKRRKVRRASPVRGTRRSVLVGPGCSIMQWSARSTASRQSG